MTTGQQGRVAAPSDGVMHRHFEAIADNYSRVRTLDIEPVRRIARLLPRRPGLVIADVGCGDGRYTELLLEELDAPQLICVDSVPEMLARAEARLALAGAPEVLAVCARAEEFAPAAGSLDAILSFNAVHHFALGPFLECAEAALRPGGRLFVYTRLQSQNERTIWGALLSALRRARDPASHAPRAPSRGRGAGGTEPGRRDALPFPPRGLAPAALRSGAEPPLLDLRPLRDRRVRGGAARVHGLDPLGVPGPRPRQLGGREPAARGGPALARLVLDPQDDLAEVGVALHVAVCLGGFLEGEDAVDHRPQRA